MQFSIESKCCDELKRSLKKTQEAMEKTVQALASSIEMRDPFSTGHQYRTANLAYMIAKEMRLAQAQIDGVYMAGVIHDIGKMHVPVVILIKPGRLNLYELSVIRAHPRFGYDILKDTALPWPLIRIVYQHHERMNGSGYPLGLSGNEILLEARILAVADVVEAMTAQRSYRPALPLESALDEIRLNKGELYDSEVVSACTRLFYEKSLNLESFF